MWHMAWSGGCAWQGGMCGRGLCVVGVHGRGAYMAGGHVWQGVCMEGGMCGRGACMVGACVHGKGWGHACHSRYNTAEHNIWSLE